MRDIGLGEEIQNRFEKCCEELIKVMDKHLPEVRHCWNQRDPNSFEQRVWMTLYLEMVHAGFYDNK